MRNNKAYGLDEPQSFVIPEFSIHCFYTVDIA